MSRYVLQVIAPYAQGDASDSANRLTFALESLAMIHGGKVVEPSEGSGYRRQYVNIYDCESSLEREIEWLKREFPEVKFALKQFMQNEPQRRQQPENPVVDEKP